MRALFEVESAGSGIASPPSALRRDEHAGSRAPSAFELQQLSKKRYDGADTPGPSIPQTPIGTRTPAEYEDDLEMSRPSSPYGQPVEVMPSLTNPVMNKWRYAAACSCFFANGLNDASTGALIPFMEAQYDISYGIVSMIFVSNAIGFIFAATYTNWLHAKIGRARHMLLAQLALVAGYVILVTTPPFWLVCVAFFLTGTGMAVSMAPINVFVCNLTNSTTLLGILHGVYGIGGICGPLIATAMVDKGIRWSSYYAIMLAISSINTVTNFWTNRGYEQDKPSPLLAALQQTQRTRQGMSRNASHRNASSATGTGTRPQTGTHTPATPGEASANAATRLKPVHPSWRQTLSRTTVMGACFIFAYQGAEVSISGWVLSFLLAYREAPFQTGSPPISPSGYNPLVSGAASNTGSLGYVTSGFWAGLTLARLFATDKLAHVFGEVWSVATLTALAAGFQLLVWLIPNLIAESVVIAILGGILGPIYPLSTVIFARYLDRKAQTSSLAVVTAMGSSGGAVAPFLVGIVSQGAGVWVLHPICIGLYAGMAGCWLALNWGRGKRRE